MLSFGIDPGSQRTGWAAVRSQGSQLFAVDYGVIRIRGDLADRLVDIFEGLTVLLADLRPDVVCLESVFHQKNAQSALTLGHARGVALLAARRSAPACVEITPAEVKKAVTGRGRADKEQVQHMIKALLGLDELPPSDAADALAVAVAGATRARFDDALAAARSATS
jgi:crossover junction endodeoxyribonuclease RuvC